MATATIHKINIDSGKLRALTAHQRYVFALIGHIFNDLMTLQKLAMVTQPAEDAEWYEREAAVGVMIQVLRTMIGRTHEAMSLLTKESIQDVLLADYFSLFPGLSNKWQAAVDKHDSMTWLAKVRNSAAFHYMNQSQYESGLTDEMCEGAHAIMGKSYGGTFFHWHDAVASVPMMLIADPTDPFQGLANMVDAMIELLDELGTCLALATNAFIMTNLVTDNAMDAAVTFDAPSIEELRLPYFFADGVHF